jgi:hypothetical protein
MEEAPLVKVMEMLLERLGRVEAAQERIEAGQSEAAAALRALERAERLRAQREAVFASDSGLHAAFNKPIVGEHSVSRVTVHMFSIADADGERHSFPRTSNACVNFGPQAVRRVAGKDPNSPAGGPDYAALEPRARAALQQHNLQHVKARFNEDERWFEVHLRLADTEQPLKPWDEWAAMAYDVLGDCLTQEGSAPHVFQGGSWLPGWRAGEASVQLEADEDGFDHFPLDVVAEAPAPPA